MKENSIIYREIEKKDYPALEKIIKDTWGYERFCSPKNAKRMSRLYLASCLANQTFTCVAENNGVAVGIIMGKNEQTYRAKLRYLWRQFYLAVPMFFNKEGRGVAKTFQGIEQLDSQLLEESNIDFQGELPFFAVDGSQRGTGIGKGLYERFQRYLKRENIKNFYLYTDCTCNFGFYEHHGLKRLAEKKFSLLPYADETMEFFLYGSQAN